MKVPGSGIRIKNKRLPIRHCGDKSAPQQLITGRRERASKEPSQSTSGKVLPARQVSAQAGLRIQFRPRQGRQSANLWCHWWHPYANAHGLVVWASFGPLTYELYLCEAMLRSKNITKKDAMNVEKQQTMKQTKKINLIKSPWIKLIGWRYEEMKKWRNEEMKKWRKREMKIWREEMETYQKAHLKTRNSTWLGMRVVPTLTWRTRPCTHFLARSHESTGTLQHTLRGNASEEGDDKQGAIWEAVRGRVYSRVE